MALRGRRVAGYLDGLGIHCTSEVRAATMSKSAVIWNARDAYPWVGISGRFVLKEAVSKSSRR